MRTLKEYEVTMSESISRLVVIQAETAYAAQELALDRTYSKDDILDETLIGNIIILDVREI